MRSHLLAIDQGTTSTRAILFDDELHVGCGRRSRNSRSIFHAPGWVEHDPEEIWATRAVDQPQRHRQGRHQRRRHRRHRHHQPARDHADLGARDRQADPPRHRLAGPPHRRSLRSAARAPATSPGSPPRPGCSSTPISPAPRSPGSSTCVPGARERAGARRTLPSAPSTPSCSGASPAARCTPPTPPTPRARSSRHPQRALRRRALVDIFDVPRAMLPEVKRLRRAISARPSPALFGGSIRIRGVAGDQQAATVGQACFEPGMVKSTYGTGCFALLNTGGRAVISRNRLLTTIAYQLAGERTYALEGAIFVAGAAVQWLRDGLGIIRRCRRDRGACRRRRSRPGGLSRAGLRRPRRPLLGRRGARRLFGLTRGTGPSRARPRRARGGVLPDARPPRGDARRLARRQRRRDGAPRRRRHGRFRLDDAVPRRHSRRPVDRPKILETTALGAAYLAGLDAGLYPPPGGIRQELAARPALHAADGRGHARPQIRRLAGCGVAGSVAGEVRSDPIMGCSLQTNRAAPRGTEHQRLGWSWRSAEPEQL